MTTLNNYVVHCNSTNEGKIYLSFKQDGTLCSFSFENATMTIARLKQVVEKMAVTEEEFIKRASGGGTNYEKI
ncbi:MAG TPA: hypothetical protein PK431_01580 [Chitinophagales bacterium]|nr:hypothetical protein [Chitinophagales bacterium]